MGMRLIVSSPATAKLQVSCPVPGKSSRPADRIGPHGRFHLVVGIHRLVLLSLPHHRS
jgi:hypothetical protein